MGIWTSAFLCAFWRLTWLPLVCMARLIWIHTHHVRCTSESSLSPSWPGWSLRVWGGGSRVAAGCFVCSWVSGYPPCTALLLPGHVSHRLSLLFTFLMRGAVLCDMWLTAMQPPPPKLPLSWLFGRDVLWQRRRSSVSTGEFLLSLLPRPALFREDSGSYGIHTFLSHSYNESYGDSAI